MHTFHLPLVFVEQDDFVAVDDDDNDDVIDCANVDECDDGEFGFERVFPTEASFLSTNINPAIRLASLELIKSSSAEN